MHQILVPLDTVYVTGRLVVQLFRIWVGPVNAGVTCARAVQRLGITLLAALLVGSVEILTCRRQGAV